MILTWFLKKSRYHQEASILKSANRASDFIKNMVHDFTDNTGDRKPVDFLIDYIKNLKVKEQTSYIDSVFYEFDGHIVFEIQNNTKHIYACDTHIWYILEKKYKYTNTKIESLLKWVIGEYMDIDTENYFISKEDFYKKSFK